MSQDALDAVVDLLDLEPIEVNIFRGQSPDQDRQRTFGGLVAGQALEHQFDPPLDHAPPPEDLPDFATRDAPYADRLGDWYRKPRPIDIRYIDWESQDRKVSLPPHQRVWVRADGTLPDEAIARSGPTTGSSTTRTPRRRPVDGASPAATCGTAPGTSWPPWSRRV